MDLCYRMGLLQSIHSPSINMGGVQCCDTAPVLGLSWKSRLGWGRRDLGPGKVQTSNVLQNMKCDESFPLGYVGFCLLFLGWGFFFKFSSLLSLFLIALKWDFVTFFVQVTSRESRAKKTHKFSSVTGGVRKWDCSCLASPTPQFVKTQIHSIILFLV